MEAIGREKEIKAWRRGKKIRLIESMNPQWKDLAKDWFSAESRPWDKGRADSAV
jgi:putative endonuclease